jgi:probable HAF family extracellular repeat protein
MQLRALVHWRPPTTPSTRWPAPGTLRSPNTWPRALVPFFLVLAGAGCSDDPRLPTDPATGELTDSVPATVEVNYEAVLLDPMGGDESNAWAINDHGVVAGWTSALGGRAVRWTDPDQAEDLLEQWSGVRGINNSGDIVGWVNPDEGPQQGFAIVDGARVDLEKLQPGAGGRTRGINDAGTIVGMSTGTPRPPHFSGAVIWHRTATGGYGAPTYLGLTNINGQPQINNRGDVVFTAFSNGHYPLIWHVEPDGGYGEPLLLGRPRPGTYVAHGLNDDGVVVGFRWTGAIEVAVVWLPHDYGNPIELSVGEAWDINNRNQIVGIAGGDFTTSPAADRRPALWTIEMDGSFTGPHDVGTPSGYESGGARQINEEGWIIGASWSPGPISATLWRPVD